MNTPPTKDSSVLKTNKPKVVAPPGQNPPRQNPNYDNPNPYFRRFGSHVKSHFSQSRCEFFESSEEETPGQEPCGPANNVNSLNHINDFKPESKANQSEDNLNSAGKAPANAKLGFLTVSGTMGKSPSIDSEHSPRKSPKKGPGPLISQENFPALNVNGGSPEVNTFSRKDSLEMELDEMDGDSDKKSALIIKSRRGSISQDSFDSGTEKIEPEKLLVNQHFQNGKVVSPPADAERPREP